MFRNIRSRLIEEICSLNHPRFATLIPLRFYSIEFKNSDHLIKNRSKQENYSRYLKTIISKLNSPDLLKSLCDLDEKLVSSENITSLLLAVEPHLDELTTDHLCLIYSEITYSCLKLKRMINEGNVKEITQFYTALHRSPVFHALLDRTLVLNESDAKLSIDSLLLIFKTFYIVKLDPNNEVFKSILKILATNLQIMNLKQQSNLLQTLTYLITRFSKSVQFVELAEKVRQMAKPRILDNQVQSVNLLIKYFESYLLHGDLDAAIHLKKQLLLGDVELNYVQSLELMRCIKSARNLKLYEQERFNDLDELITKCNSYIVKTLTASPTMRPATFCLIRLHDQTDMVNFDLEKFYHPSLPMIITEIFANYNTSPLGNNLKIYLFNMARNYAQFQIFDENLSKLLYTLACAPESQNFRDKFNITLFSHLSKFHLPFVDYKQLGKQILDSIDYKLSEKIKINALLKFVCDLILYDVDDRRLLDCMNTFMRRFNEPLSDRKITLQLFKHLNLAKVYLSESRLNVELRSKMKSRFDDLFAKISYDQLFPVDFEFLALNSRVQKHAYLSNGLFIGSLVIYDRSIQDLVPLTEFQFKFKMVDKIQLNENQQVIAMIQRFSTKNIAYPHKFGYLFHLSNILQTYNIKTIEILLNEVKDLETKEVADFYIKKALENCK